jgi:hypothetical protein
MRAKQRSFDVPPPHSENFPEPGKNSNQHGSPSARLSPSCALNLSAVANISPWCFQGLKRPLSI